VQRGVLMSTARLLATDGALDGSGVAATFGRALRDRASGRAIVACETWARLELVAREAGARHLAVQAGAERSLTLTWMGALSVAGVLCEQLLEELEQLEREPAELAPPPLSPSVINGWAGAWFSVSGLHRLRAEQLRRAGDYAGALEELEEANRSSDQRPQQALPLWGRVILSESLRLTGDFEGAYEVAATAARRARGSESHPWVRVTANRATARALLALGEVDDALAGFRTMAEHPAHRHADGGIACDLGIGEALRRQSKLARAESHLERASAIALDHGHVLGWIHAQLCLAELGRERGDDAREISVRIDDVLRRLLLAEHPWLRLRAFALGALSADGSRAERLIDRAEEELPRFQRRSCDLELERELVENCRVAVVGGDAVPPIALDFL
jgi:tetratricopeptide (TPR) repeat protein